MNPSPERGSKLRGDLFGGITAGIIALPLALAFGVSSGLGAECGLYGAILVGFFASLLGGTAVQISGPTGPMTVVTAVAVKELIAVTGSVEGALPALVATFVLAGLMQVGMGLTGIGALIKFIPYPVVSGFMSGIGVIIVLLQLFPAIGKVSPAGGPLGVVQGLGAWPVDMNVAALALTAGTIAIIYLLPRLTKAVPSPLVALLGLSVVATGLGPQVPVIGDIPTGFPTLHATSVFGVDPALSMTVIEFAATLAALGAIDSLLTSVVADNLTGTRHDSNRELIGQGIGNAVAGAFAGLPGAGATMRTVVNVQAGGRTRLSGAVHSLLLLAILLGLGAYAAYIPKAVLAGILITVGIGILDFRGLRHVRRVPRADAAVMISVLVVTVFVDLLVAVGIGMVMASVLFMRRMAEIVEDGVELERAACAEPDRVAGEEELPAGFSDRVLIKTIRGPVFFGFAKAFQQRLQELPEVDVVVLRLRHVPFIDQTGVYALEEAVRGLRQRGVRTLVTGLRTQPHDLLRRLRVVPDLIAEEQVFDSLSDALTGLGASTAELRSAAVSA